MDDKELRMAQGQLNAVLEQGVAAIDDLLNELEEHPERFTPDFLDAVEKINLKERFRMIRTEFKQVEEDVRNAPPESGVYPDPHADINGTSMMGALDPITYTELVAKLGEPHQGVSGDNKVDAEWCFQTPAGVATIYNYKSGPAYNPGENISLADVDDWHIGGRSEAVVAYIREYVANR